MILLGIEIGIAIMTLVAVVYVHQLELRMKQWTMSELWHARQAHLKECHPEHHSR